MQKTLNNAIATERFHQVFAQIPLAVAHAPGRVNLIGEHTDYNEGFVLPAAINFGTWVAFSARDDQQVRAVAYDMASQQVTLDLQQAQQRDPNAPWSDYLRGVVRELQVRGYRLRGANLL
ncbi:MAG: galactokinase family protein, partial [Natronospirillum sp.]